MVCTDSAVHLAPPFWAGEHARALQAPRDFECAIVHLRSALLSYATEYKYRFDGDQIGQDSVLGEAWLQIARAYLALLNGETGRLDCGTLDGEMRRWAQQYGFEVEL